MNDLAKKSKEICWWLLVGAGIALGTTQAVFYNLLVFPLIGILTAAFFPGSYLKRIGLLLGINYGISVPVFMLTIRGGLSGTLLTGLIYSGIYIVLSTIGLLIVYFAKGLLDQSGGLGRRTLFGLGASLLVVMLLQSGAGLIGNPLIFSRARHAIEEHVAAAHPQLNLEVGQVRFDWRVSQYFSRVWDPEQEDVYFHVFYRPGPGVVADGYEMEVLTLSNTFNRLATAYTELIREVMGPLGLRHNQSRVWYNTDDPNFPQEAIFLGMDFDPAIPLSTGILLDFETRDPSLQVLGAQVMEIFQLLEGEELLLQTYSLRVRTPDALVEITGLSQADFEASRFLAWSRTDFADVPPHIQVSITQR